MNEQLPSQQEFESVVTKFTASLRAEVELQFSERINEMSSWIQKAEAELASAKVDHSKQIQELNQQCAHVIFKNNDALNGIRELLRTINGALKRGLHDSRKNLQATHDNVMTRFPDMQIDMEALTSGESEPIPEEVVLYGHCDPSRATSDYTAVAFGGGVVYVRAEASDFRCGNGFLAEDPREFETLLNTIKTGVD